FGLRRRLTVVMEQSLLVHDQVLINGGQRGVLLKMAPGDIAAGLNCRLGDLLADSAPGSA
nr:hypothetical protein [Desulfobacterales bacterium]